MKIRIEKKEPKKAVWVRLPKDEQLLVERTAKENDVYVSDVLRYLITTTNTIDDLKNNSIEN